jgi:nickel transport protein
MIARLLISLSLLLAVNPLATGHTVEHTVLEKGIGVEVHYADGSAMSFSGVKVFSPTDAQNVFQEGATDKNGRFVFYPDVKGTWKIEVNDGMGHGLVTDINVTEGMIPAQDEDHHSRTIPEKIIMGVCIIWGLTGLLFFIRAKQLLKQKVNLNNS